MSHPPLALTILSVNTGMPALLGHINGEPVISAIRKRPVSTKQIALSRTLLDGDGQANLSVHGGPDKAVYAYSADHWAWWTQTHRFPCHPGAFGENVTLQGADEDAIRIGDMFAWGPAILQVSEPRGPCQKFALASERADAPQIMTLSGRCGWYFRVLETGTVPVDGVLTLIERDPSAPTVRETFLIRHRPKSDPALLDRAIATPHLAQAWRQSLIRARQTLQAG